jgi:hypothetical protein
MVQEKVAVYDSANLRRKVEVAQLPLGWLCRRCRDSRRQLRDRCVVDYLIDERVLEHCLL